MLRWCNPLIFLIILVVFPVQTAIANSCLAPERPFLPSGHEEMKRYADLLRADFERYIEDVQNYFMCLDNERSRAFIEAQEVTEDYVRFVDIISE